MDIEQPGARAEADMPVTVEVSHVIVRACRECGSPRQIGQPCGHCGLAEPPEVADLGVTTAAYRSPLRRLLWMLGGRHLARMRVHRANRRAAKIRVHPHRP